MYQLLQWIFVTDNYGHNVTEAYTKVKFAPKETQNYTKESSSLSLFVLTWVFLPLQKVRSRKMEGKKDLLKKLSLHYYEPFSSFIRDK